MNYFDNHHGHNHRTVPTYREPSSFITNFLASRVEWYKKAIEATEKIHPELVGKFRIVDTAYDCHGRIIEDSKSIHCEAPLGQKSLFDFWEILDIIKEPIRAIKPREKAI
jgi:hypothetical protein